MIQGHDGHQGHETPQGHDQHAGHSVEMFRDKSWWAARYNIAAIPLAAGVLAPRGVVLNPAVGAILMSLSTVVVALNAQLLRRVAL